MTKNMGASPAIKRHTTREEHRAYLARAEDALVRAGAQPSQAARYLAAETGVGERQAFRYVKAVRSIYARRLASMPATTLDEFLVTVQHRIGAAIEQEPPDYKASIKAMELYARLRGWLDRKVSVSVSGTVTHEHRKGAEELSDRELDLLRQLHAAREERLALASGAVVDSTAEPVEG